MSLTDPIAEPFEPGSHWVPLRAGWLTATGGPSRQLTAEELVRGARSWVLVDRLETLLAAMM